jgi:hypothetical protein
MKFSEVASRKLILLAMWKKSLEIPLNIEDRGRVEDGS